MSQDFLSGFSFSDNDEIHFSSQQHQGIDQMILENIGQNHEDWIQFLISFPSSKLYSLRVNHFDAFPL